MTTSKRSGRTGQAKEIDRKVLGTRLREAREYLELSQDEVAKILKLPRPAISQIESGQRKVEVIELTKMAEVYQRPLEFFMGDVGSEPIVPESVQHLARAAAKLTDKDREELLRFAKFLRLRGKT